jgi:hypothetical protein
MRLRDFLDQFEDMPDDYDVVISCVAAPPDEEGGEIGLFVVDCPVIGIAVNEEDTEIRLVVSRDSLDAIENVCDGRIGDIIKLMD